MKEPSLSHSRFRKKSASKVKLICSFNGAFHVQPSSNNLRYIGGETRIISVDRTISFPKLRLKISDICSNIPSFTLKYRLPLNPDRKQDDDTPLVLIASDDDVRCMVEEYDKLESCGKHARLWVFVCTDLCDDDKCSFNNNGVVKGKGVADDSLRKKVMKQQLLAKQSCDSPLIDLDFGLEEPNDLVVKNDPFRVNVANGLDNGRLRPLNPRDGNVRNIPVQANASVERLVGRSFQGFCYGGGNTTLMGNSVDCKWDFGNTGQMPFSNFNSENIMPWGATCGSVNNHLGVQSCSNLPVGSGCPVNSSCVGDRVCCACQSGLRGNRFAVNDARYQRNYSNYARKNNNLVEVGTYRGARLDGKIPVGKCYLGIRPKSNISKQGKSMGLYNANLSSPWAGFTELASEGVVSVMGSCFNKGISTFDVQYGEKFREHGGPTISQYGLSNLVESHLACHSTCNVVGDQSHTAINNPSTFVRVMNTKDDMLTGSKLERHEVQCQALYENFHGMPITCKPIHPELENEKLLIDSEESANISGLSNNMNYRNGTASGCNMKNGTKNLQGGVASSMDLLYNLSLSSSKEIEPPQISTLQNAATERIDEHKEEIHPDPLEEEVETKKTCECSKVIGEISSRSAAYFTNTANAELQTIKTSDLEYIKELGSGTFGTVFYGKWKGSDVAIKRIKPSCFTEGSLEEDRLIADFWREAHMLGQIHHPNVVAFYGVVTDGPVTNLATVTEYMVNGSLKQVLRRKDRTIDRRKRIIIAMDAAFGIEYLHEKNIVHFDLKSHNFLVNMRDPQRPVCKIGDLGLSKIKQKTLISGGVRGTIPWMAPELFKSKDNLVTEKVDVYSFGVVMWELLTGEEPYADLHSEEIIAGIIKGNLGPKIPSWCEPTWRSLMERCWSSDPKSRPAFSEITKELRAMAAAMNIK